MSIHEWSLLRIHVFNFFLGCFIFPYLYGGAGLLNLWIQYFTSKNINIQFLCLIICFAGVLTDVPRLRIKNKQTNWKKACRKSFQLGLKIPVEKKSLHSTLDSRQLQFYSVYKLFQLFKLKHLTFLSLWIIYQFWVCRKLQVIM